MTRPWQVDLAEAADRDIDDIIAESIRLFGPAQARAYEDLMAAAVLDLRNGPNIFRSVSRDEIAEGLRTLRIARRGRRASHHLVYRTQGSELIEVVRILPVRMDIARHLPPDLN